MASVAYNDEPTPKRTGGVTGKGFLPGKSGNPSGKPKGIAAKARELIGDDPTELLEVFLEIAYDPKAKPGDRKAAAEALLDRAYGRVPSYAPIDGEDPLDLSVLSDLHGLIDELSSRRDRKTPPPAAPVASDRDGQDPAVDEGRQAGAAAA